MPAREELESVELAPEDRRAARAACASAFDLSICGRRVCLRSNAPALLESYLRTHAAFRVETDAAAPADLELAVYREAQPRPRLLFLIRDRAYRTEEASLLVEPETVLNYLMIAHTRSHYLVHAGAVSRNGRGIVIAAGSHMGKSTLTAFLVARGFQYLSDEIAPISRADGALAPYPLPLGIRPGPATALVEHLPGTDFVSGTDRKKLVRADDFAPVIAGAPVPLRAVVFITSRVSAEVRTARRFDGVATVLFSDMTPECRAALLARTGAELVAEQRVEGRLPALTLRTRAPETLLECVRAVAAEHGIGLVFFQHEDLDAKDFDAEPQLLKLPAAAGVIELSKKIPASQKAELVRTQFGGRVPGLIEELSRRTAGAAFYKISPGRIESMVRAIESWS